MRTQRLLLKGVLAFILFGCVSLQDAKAQQNPQYSMYMFNPLTSNPAYAGSRDALSFTLLGRKQWVNIEGAPLTGTLSLHSPLRNEAIALGFSVVHDEIGPTKNTSLYGDIAYRFKLTEASKLAFGVKGGIDLYSANFNGLRVDDPTDVIYTTPIKNEVMPNFGAGVYWYSDKYYVGLTAPKFLENGLVTSKVSNAAFDSVSRGSQKRHYFLMAGYSFTLNSVVDMIPSFVIKAVPNAPLGADVNLNFLFYEKLWLGAMYRFGNDGNDNGSAFGGKNAVGLDIVYHFSPKFRAGYAYDYTLSDLGNYETGSHEIMLNYDLDFLGKGFKTPRRF